MGVATAPDLVSVLCWFQGKHAEPISLHKGNLNIMEKAFGSEHADLASILNNLPRSHFDPTGYAKAEALDRHELVIPRRNLGPKHPVSCWPELDRTL